MRNQKKIVYIIINNELDLIKDIFNFKSEIICVLNLVCLEEMLFNEINHAEKIFNSSITNKTKSKFQLINEISFESFLQDICLDDERKSINEIIKKSKQFNLT